MNRKALDKPSRNDLKSLAKRIGWKGGGLDNLKSWMESEGYGALKERSGAPEMLLEDFDEIWANHKTVTVTVAADAGEEIAVVDGSEPSEAMEDEDEIDGKADEDDEDEAEIKALRKELAEKRARAQRSRDQFAQVNRINGKAASRSKAVNTENAWARKRYNQKAARGETVFTDADQADFYSAMTRLNSMGNRGYVEKQNDIAIVTKAGATYDNSLGGVLVPDQFSSELISLLPKYGTAREYAGVYNMAGPREFIPRFGADVTTYKLAEGIAATESEPTFDGVWLNSEEIGSLTRMPLRLLEKAAINVSDEIANSTARSQAKFEDQSFWNSANGFQGISSKVGSNNTHTVSGASAYTDVTVSDVQTWLSKLPDWVDDFEDQLAIYCHKSVDEQIFQRFGPAAGGAATIDMATGRLEGFRGVPIRHVNVMNNARAFTSGNVIAYVGPLQACTKFGEVEGSRRVLESDQRYMEFRQWASLSSVEIAINPHNVSDTAESGLFALKVTS